MSNLLFIAFSYPQPDESSGDLRFFTTLSLLVRKHTIVFCALDGHGTPEACDKGSIQLEQLGITLGEIDLPHVLRGFQPDIVWCEFYHQVRTDFLRLFEQHCPEARIVVDSVDVHFNRLEALAKLTGKAEDKSAAIQMKVQELKAYSNCDMIIAVSKNDQLLIQQALPNKPVDIIPNIHTVGDFHDRSKRQNEELIFVGGFSHSPNIDAMLYFCSEVMPLILTARPHVRLKIIGSNAPQVITALASEHIEVVGFVPETTPYLQHAYISIAPLRYGGGMKGKVGEAMSHGLPVVTTSFGVEGFGLDPGEDALIGDEAESFAKQVITLLDDPKLYERIARNGYNFIKQNYSVPAVEHRLDLVIQRALQLAPRKIPFHRKFMQGAKGWYVRNISWRFKQS